MQDERSTRCDVGVKQSDLSQPSVRKIIRRRAKIEGWISGVQAPYFDFLAAVVRQIGAFWRPRRPLQAFRSQAPRLGFRWACRAGLGRLPARRTVLAAICGPRGPWVGGRSGRCPGAAACRQAGAAPLPNQDEDLFQVVICWVTRLLRLLSEVRLVSRVLYCL